jgi:NADH:ubiquinone oxidoreductase subunit 2 (subunit N)
MFFIIRLIFFTSNLNLILGLSSLFQISFLIFLSNTLYYELYIISISYLNWYFFITLFLLLILLKFKNLYSISYINTIKLYNKLDSFSFNILILLLMGFPPFIGWFFKFYILKYLIEINYLYSSLILFVLFILFSFIYVKIFFIFFQNKRYKIYELENNNNYFFSFFFISFIMFNLFLIFYPYFIYEIFYVYLLQNLIII